MPPRIECHSGIIGQQSDSIDLDHGVIGAPATLPVHPGKCHQHAAALTALGGKQWAAVRAYHSLTAGAQRLN